MWGKQKLSQKPYLILLIIIIGVSVGSASALFVHNENTLVKGTLKITDGELTVDRVGAPSAITVQNDGFSNAIKFSKTTAGNQQIFQFRQNAAGDTLDIIDITNNKVMISGKAVTGNVGIGTTNPTSKLHVVGDFTLQSNIICTDCIDSTDIAANAVGASEIADGSITSADLAPGVAGVPIGTVLDWWCSVDCTIPDGFRIADGSLVNDPASPFNGENLPNLTDKFVRGTTSVVNVGNTGGTSSHSHSVDPPNTGTSSAGVHDHQVDIGTFRSGPSPISHTHVIDPPTTAASVDTHNHKWSIWGPGLKTWDSFKSDGTKQEIFNWNDGMNTAGAGNFPLATKDALGAETHFTDNNVHTHAVNIGPFTSSATLTSHDHSVNPPITSTTPAPNHNHEVDIGPFNSDNVNHEPPFFVLVKIIRIK